MEQIELRVATREVLGKKVRFLRREGIVPLHLFGHGVESLALQCDSAQIRHVLAQAGQARLISVKIDKARKPRNIFVREIQRNPVTGELLHVDLYQVRMEEQLKVDVPIVLVGEAPALKTKGSILVQELYSLTVEALPDKIPARVEVDISSLAEVEKAIHVKDILLGDGIKIINDPEQMVLKITAAVAKEEEVVKEAVEAPEVEVVGPTPEVESKAEEE
jgi:large subunit ribosomal protein L25